MKKQRRQWHYYLRLPKTDVTPKIQRAILDAELRAMRAEIKRDMEKPA